MNCPLLVRALEAPVEPAIISGDLTWTNKDFHGLVSEFAGGLRQAGVNPGDIVALWLDSSVEYVALLFACWRMGVVAAPLNTRLPPRTANEMARRIRAKLVVADRERISGSRSIDNLHRGEQTEAAVIDINARATIVFTSGSLAEPKAVVHRYANHSRAAIAANRRLPIAPGDRWLLSLPLYHVAGIGILFRCAIAGAAIVIGNPGEITTAALVTGGVTHLSLVATQLRRALSDPATRDALARMKVVLLGGGPTPDSILCDAVAAGIPLYNSFGMTETSALITCTRPGAGIEELQSAGMPLTDGTVSISPDGEILVRGETIFEGYLHEDGALERPLAPEGWFATGDLGVIDADGLLHVTGRRDNRFISGGENIQPEEIEHALRAIPGIEDAVVVPIDDAEFGQRPAAIVKRIDAAALDPAQLRIALAAVLPRYKIPVAFHAWPVEADTGLKPSRAWLREWITRA